MPQFELDRGTAEAADAFDRLDIFTQAYIEAMFWTAVDWNDQDAFENPNEFPEWDFSMLAPATLATIVADCADFQRENAADLEDATTGGYGQRGRDYDAASAGHDFWLTRNRNGVGFWDRDLGDLGDRLTAAAHAWGECDLYRGDDGRLYL